MPGSMIHLLVARKVCQNCSALFYIGSIAPDAVNDWHEKDITHFRNLENRLPSLINLAQKTSGDFAEGILLHLFFDWRWDTTVRDEYIKTIGDDWFSHYRNELSLAGSYAFHHTEWANQVWAAMDKIGTEDYGTTPSATIDDVRSFVSRNYKWHSENVTVPSLAFPPEKIEAFTAQIAKEYVKWRADNICP